MAENPTPDQGAPQGEALIDVVFGALSAALDMSYSRDAGNAAANLAEEVKPSRLTLRLRQAIDALLSAAADEPAEEPTP